MNLLLILLWLTGVDSVSAEWFRTWYHRSDLVHYLEAINDHTIVETHTTGQWTEPEQLVFSVEGIDYTRNRYYIDGFRVDDRFNSGSTLYRPDMQAYNMTIGTHTAQIRFEHDTTARDYVQASYNFGQITNGEPAPGTAALIHIFHRTPMESADTWKHINARRHYKGAGTAEAAVTLHDKDGNGYRQHFYAAYGQRQITRQDHLGLITDNPFYTTYYYKVQADGYLPMKPNRAFDKYGYRLNFSGRGDGGSEFYYNHDEVYDLKNYSGSLYVKRNRKQTGDLTTGLTWATNVVHHADRSFARNIVDQDGESFYPWVPDGKNHELSWAVNYRVQIQPWLHFAVDGYNSLFYFRPEVENWSNRIYLQGIPDAQPMELGEKTWTSRAHASGLLENTFAMQIDHTLHPMLDMHAQLGMTVDGMLLRGKSKVSPNIDAAFNLDLHPCRWFEMGLGLGYHPFRYTAEYLRFFDGDYLSSGAHHKIAGGLRQTTYLELDLPIRFHFSDKRGVHHEFALQQSFKKYFNVWRVNELTEDGDFIVGEAPAFGSDPLVNTSMYLSQLSRYTLTGKHVTFSLGWQSILSGAYAALGHGPNGNSIGVLSESMAYPSTTQVVDNSQGRYQGAGRTDNDKGFVCRIYFGYNICRWVQMGFTAKWTDGKPFSAYYYTVEDGQVTIYPRSSRGTNPTDQNFGTRNCANWQIDLHVQGKWNVSGHEMTANLECYNVYDFACDQSEMAFPHGLPDEHKRVSGIFNVPTGLLLRYRCEL